LSWRGEESPPFKGGEDVKKVFNSWLVRLLGKIQGLISGIGTLCPVSVTLKMGLIQVVS
jgi:hypothetical protein